MIEAHGDSATLHHARFDARKIDRPARVLFHYYVAAAILTGPLFPLALVPLWFRYVTLRYRFDDEGVSMRWGFLFRREVYLTYRRIQDIHLTSGILQRWFGLATISVQTASGSSEAEMSIEGIPQAEELRDFLYSKMRGAVESTALPHATDSSGPALSATAEVQEESLATPETALQLLSEIRDAMQRLANQRGAQ